MTPTTLADLFTQAEPKHPALILDDGTTLTHRRLADLVEALAGHIHSAALSPGQVAAIVLPNGLEYLACFLAVTRAGLIAAPLNPAYKAEEFRFYLEDAGARAVIGPPGAHAFKEAAAALRLPVWVAARAGRGRVVLVDR